jgi:transposase-like protein
LFGVEVATIVMETASMKERSRTERGRGRPTRYSEALDAEICQMLATSDVGIREICKQVGIEPSTFFLWRHRYPDFSEHVSRAMALHYETVGESLLDYTERDVIAGDRSDSARVQQQRLRVETRRWVLTKKLPEVYGDRLQIDADLGFAMPDIRPESVRGEQELQAAQGDSLPTQTPKRAALPPRGSGTR